MRGLLLDTNAVLRVIFYDTTLSDSMRKLLMDAPLFASVVSAAEIAVKTSIGKLPLPPPFETDFGGAFRSALERSAIDLLPLDLIAIEHMRHLPLHHRDPFDRLIIGQAFASGLTVVTSDRVFAAYAGLDILRL